MLDRVFKLAVIAASSLYIFRALSGICFSPGWWTMGPSLFLVTLTLFIVLGMPFAVLHFWRKSRK